MSVDYIARTQIGLDNLSKGIETWFGHPTHTVYEASNFGRIRTVPRNLCNRFIPSRILSLKTKTASGYINVAIGGHKRQRHYHAHRLVLETFAGFRPNGMVCRHFPDRNVANNRLDNIQWGTPKENSEDQEVHGTANRGNRHSTAILREEDIPRILDMKSLGRTSKYIAGLLGVDPSTISSVVTGKTWKEERGKWSMKQ